jgi:hypothetical protein
MQPTPVTYNGFAGGVNTFVPARDIDDTEVVEATNFELYPNSVMRARNGLTKLVGSLAGTASSIFHFAASGGSECVLITAGNKLYRMPVGGGSVTDLTASLTLPSSGPWQWVVMNDKAIGVNRGTGSNANPIVVDSPTATSAAR